MRIPILAAAALCIITGCAGFDDYEMGGGTPGRENVLKADILYRNGDYPGALVEYRRYLEAGDKKFADEALFRMGYIHLFYEEKPGGAERARKAFGKLGDEFPESPRKSEADNFLKILEQIGNLEKENKKLRADLQKMLDLDIQLEEKRKALQ